MVALECMHGGSRDGFLRGYQRYWWSRMEGEEEQARESESTEVGWER
jgi:hypothetical protein